MAANTEFFQGRIAYFGKKQIQREDYYAYRNKPVTVVASSVPSVVVSGVDSEVSSTVVSEVPSTVVSEVPSTVVSEVPSTVTSDVPSAVGSAVTSSVASGVPISKKDARSVRIYKLPKLTPKVLLDFAQKDYIKNPAKYRLSEKEIIKLLKMYEPEIMEKQMEFYDESLNETLERDSLIDKELIERDSLKLDTNKMDTLELSTF